MATEEMSRFGVEDARLDPRSGSILGRGDVQFLSRKPETGGTPTLPGVEFVRYRRSYGLGFRATGPESPWERFSGLDRAPGTDGRLSVGQGLPTGGS